MIKRAESHLNRGLQGKKAIADVKQRVVLVDGVPWGGPKTRSHWMWFPAATALLSEAELAWGKAFIEEE